jgi:hypothetical protein
LKYLHTSESTLSNAPNPPQGLILLQTTSMAALHDPIRVYNLGALCFLSSLVTVITVTYHAVLKRSDPLLNLRVVNIVTALLSMIAGVVIPRRPQVFFRDRLVEPQRSSTILSRFTWGWTYQLTAIAAKKGDLDEQDIPEPDHVNRSEELVKDWIPHGFKKRKLIWSILDAYKWRVILQHVVVTIRCIWGVMPFWIMKSLIDTLQIRGGGGSPTLYMWSLAIGLGLSTLLETVSWSRIGKPFQVISIED